MQLNWDKCIHIFCIKEIHSKFVFSNVQDVLKYPHTIITVYKHVCRFLVIQNMEIVTVLLTSRI